MDVEIRSEPVEFDLYGLEGKVAGHDYAGTGTRLMGELADKLKAAGIPYKGVECWVYDTSTTVFVGSCFDDPSSVREILTHKHPQLARYLYYKYKGPYEGLGEVHAGLEKEMAGRGLAEAGPRIEKYGRWTEDPQQRVTEVFVGLV